VKQRVAVMLGVKGFRNAAITIARIELCTASARDSSDCEVSPSTARLTLHLQSGTRCFGPELCSAKQTIVWSCRLFAPEPRDFEFIRLAEVRRLGDRLRVLIE
jgi:hypothetical protein